MAPKPVLSRILLKLSGEVLANKDGFGIDTEKVLYLAQQIPCRIWAHLRQFARKRQRRRHTRATSLP